MEMETLKTTRQGDAVSPESAPMQTQTIRILSRTSGKWTPEESAAIVERSPCPRIRLGKLRQLFGPDVPFTDLGTHNPHLHDGFRGTIGLFYESTVLNVSEYAVFCILEFDIHPIVLNTPIDQEDRGPEVHTIASPVSNKKGMLPLLLL